MALGIDKNIAFDWRHGRSRTTTHADFIKKVQIICGGFREALMLDGQINPVTGIFWRKNCDGLKDIQDVVIMPNNPLGETVSAEELRRKYLDNIVSDYSVE